MKIYVLEVRGGRWKNLLCSFYRSRKGTGKKWPGRLGLVRSALSMEVEGLGSSFLRWRRWRVGGGIPRFYLPQETVEFSGNFGVGAAWEAFLQISFSPPFFNPYPIIKDEVDDKQKQKQ